MRRASTVTVIAALLCASAAAADGRLGLLASHRVLLAAATIPSHETNDARFAIVPGDAIDDAVLGALPIRPEDFEASLSPPPEKVTLDNSYAPVVFSHAGHLSRRTTCKKCHGDGPVRKIGRFQPKDAHDRCRKCHLEAARGPTDCKGCHQVKPKPEPVIERELSAREKAIAAASAQPALPVSVAMLTPGAALPFNPDAANGAFNAAATWPAPPGAAAPGGSSPAAAPSLATGARHSVFAGGSVLGGGKGTKTVPAAALKLTLRQEGFELTESLEWGERAGTRRVLGLVGGGIVRPVRPQLSAHVLALAGFDAISAGWSTFQPAAGLRAGVEWTTPATFFRSVDLSLSALYDVNRGHDPSGASIGGAVYSVSLTAGFDLRRR